MWEKLNKLIKPNGAIVLFGSEPFSSALRMSNLEMFKYDWIWEKDTKSNFLQAKNQPLNNLENISIFSNGYARNFPKGSDKLNQVMPYYPQMVDGDKYKIPKEAITKGIFKTNHKNGKFKRDKMDTKKRYPYRIIKINTDKDRLHPTQKPVALIEYLIKTYTNENELVLDFTMGSGTTGIACKNLNRNFIGIELDKEYFNLAKERIEKHNVQLKLF